MTTTTYYPEEFDAYNSGLIKSGSNHKKRRSKRKLEQVVSGSGAFGCCAGPSKRNKTFKNNKAHHPVKSPYLGQFKRTQKSKLEEEREQEQSIDASNLLSPDVVNMQVDRPSKNNSAPKIKKAQTKNVSEKKRKYSIVEMRQKAMLDEFIDAYRFSNPAEFAMSLVPKQHNSKGSSYQDNPFQVAA